MVGEAESLSAELEALKREGANLLVLSGGVDSGACHGLLGECRETRRRLFVTTGEVPDDLRVRACPNPTPKTVGHVHVTTGQTRAAAQQSNGESADWTPATVSPTSEEHYSVVSDPTDLRTLSRHVHQHLHRFEGAVPEPKPGEIRLCFDSLDPILDAVDRSRLQEFLQTVSTRVRLARGIAHYHLSLSAARMVPDEIAPYFDGVVERRQTSDGPRQRWTLRESGVQTDWLPLRP
ncbi:MAG: hypothetical protein ABEJ22_03695 [Haloferacaceae archaeon]